MICCGVMRGLWAGRRGLREGRPESEFLLDVATWCHDTQLPRMEGAIRAVVIRIARTFYELEVTPWSNL
jgi:hypothetical protein